MASIITLNILLLIAIIILILVGIAVLKILRDISNATIEEREELKIIRKDIESCERHYFAAESVPDEHKIENAIIQRKDMHSCERNWFLTKEPVDNVMKKLEDVENKIISSKKNKFWFLLNKK